MTHENESQSPPAWTAATVDMVVSADGVFCDGDWVESKDQDPDGDVRLIQLADIGDGEFLDKSARFLTKKKAQELNCTFLAQGDLLIARMPEPLGRACIFPLSGLEKFVTVVDVCIVRTNNTFANPKYLMHVVNSPVLRTQIESFKSGSTRKRISRGNLARVQFPVPPRTEQDRIVAKIEKLFSELDNGIESLKLARKQTDIYRQSVLKQAFEGNLTAHWRTEATTEEIRPAPSTAYSPSLPQSALGIHTLPALPRTWHWSKLGDIADITGGLTKNPARIHFPRRVKYLRVANVYADSLNLDEVHEIGVTDAELKRVLLKRGDLLIVEGNGSIDQIGRVAAWGGEIPECAHQNHIIKARPHANVRTRYLLHFLLSKVGRGLIMREASSTSGLHTLSVTKVSNLKIPLTCVEEQEQVLLAIDEKLSVAEKFIEEIDKAIVACKVLRRSILKKAFSGELVAQDDKDEPACALLERIKSERADKDKTKKRNGRRKAA